MSAPSPPRYPLRVTEHRTLPADYSGNAFVWDIDKTYLATRFSSLGGLLRIPLEFAVDKLAIAGMPEVLRGLRRGPGEGLSCEPLYFVSASPSQLLPVLERKMLLDSVEHDGIILKDWGAVLRAARPRRLKEQIGFKMNALLTGRKARPRAVEYLFGDDVEHDGLVYSIYARVLAGELDGRGLESELRAHGVSRLDVACARALLQELPAKLGRVERIFVHLVQGTPPAQFAYLGPRVVPVQGAFQLALALFALSLVQPVTVTLAAEAWREQGGSDRELQGFVADALARGLLSAQCAAELGW
jgi:hypothetical protein